MAINSKNKVPEFSIEQEQNEFAASTEREKIKGSKNLNVPPLRFPEFTDEWTDTTIGSIATVVGGGTPDTTQKDNWDGNILWYTPSEIGKEKYLSDSERRITNIGLKSSGAKLLPKGTILLTSRATIGECSIAAYECSTNQGFQSLIANQGVNNEFLFYLVASKRRELLKRACGSTFLEISANEVRKIKVKSPSIDEQNKIASLLALIDERIATQSRIIDKLQSLMSGICERLSYSDMGENIKLGDILLERIEKTTKNNQYEILSSTVKGIFLQREYFSKDIASEDNIGYKVVRLNDIVLSPQNLWMGNINFNDKFQIGAVSPSYKVFTIAEQFYKPFISAILKTRRALYNYELVSEQGASIVRRNLNMEAFEQLTFKIPSYDRQVQIGNVILTLQHRIDLTKKLYSAMIQQKQWFLQQMFI